MTPFSREVRNQMRRRAGNKSELSGRTDRPLEGSHFDHTRNEHYNDPKNGALVTDIEQLVYHMIYAERPELIGLTRSQNDWAINTVKERVEAVSRALGTLDKLEDEIGEASVLWHNLLKNNTCKP